MEKSLGWRRPCEGEDTGMEQTCDGEDSGLAKTLEWRIPNTLIVREKFLYV